VPVLIHSSSDSQTSGASFSDEDLLLAIQQEEEWALDKLIERKSKPLLQHVYRIVGDREDARDIVQLTFVRVWEHRDRFDRRWTVNTWIYRIASNLGIDFLRSRQSKLRQLEPVRRHFSSQSEVRQLNELARLGRTEVDRILCELAMGLTEKQRQVFLLRELAGLSSREVARIAGCRESTVRNHLFTARRYLRKELLRRYPEYAGTTADGAAANAAPSEGTS
jgi:RNA polymerase sigma-70 factor (ECF subfamily)